jgi:serine/threonine protein kinase
VTLPDQDTLDAPPPDGPSPVMRAAAALADYLARVDAGQAPNRDELLNDHPDAAAALRSYFEVALRLDRSLAAAKKTIDELGEHTLDEKTGSALDKKTLDELGELDEKTLGAETMGAETLGATLAAPFRDVPPLAKGATPLGDYELLEPIARGGMGIVYKARQRRLNRIVAVKMILSGHFADKDDVDRFYAEAEAAARLRHPHIVGIHEVGQCEGQHFFSMDYIDGKSLADLVREKPLLPEDAARHVKTISLAMQYAHDRGILHRDLKPANVLVDRSGQPLVTDFGLSKRVDGDSQLTMPGGIIGTPSYMPPEQAAGKNEEVGVRSDVYSLGAILYQLLTGSPPFRSASVAQTIQQVLHNEPAAPRVLNPNVPPDLETICLKCLQKEPGRRYHSAQELADELDRFLEGKPIQARPIGPLARTWRWCRRNPLVASLSAAALTLLLVLLGASAWYNVQISRAKAESDEFLRQAEEAVDELFVEVSDNTLLNQPGMQPLREKLLRRALAYYRRFLAERGDDPALQDRVAQTQFRIGLITEAIESRERAVASYEAARQRQERLVAQSPRDAARVEALGKTLNALGAARHRLRRFDAARQAYDDAVAVRKRLLRLAPHAAEHQRTLANSYMNLGLLAQDMGDIVEALRQFETAQKLRREFLDAGRDDRALRSDLGKGHYNLANLAHQQGDLEVFHREMTSAVRQFEQLEREDPSDFDIQHRLAIGYHLLAELEPTPQAALETLHKSLKLLDPLARNNPTVVDYQFDLAGLRLTLGAAHRAHGVHGAQAEALAAFERAREILQPLVDRTPDSIRFRRELAVALRELAVELAAAGRVPEARGHLDSSRVYLEQLVSEHGEDEDFRLHLAETLAEIERLEQPGKPNALEASP